jgi:hypothetical protein
MLISIKSAARDGNPAENTSLMKEFAPISKSGRKKVSFDLVY